MERKKGNREKGFVIYCFDFTAQAIVKHDCLSSASCKADPRFAAVAAAGIGSCTTQQASERPTPNSQYYYERENKINRRHEDDRAQQKPNTPTTTL
jgi:hypothetical protein